MVEGLTSSATDQGSVAGSEEHRAQGAQEMHSSRSKIQYTPNGIVQMQKILVTLAERPHPFPSRTRKLSSPAPKILRGQPFGKIGRRQDFCVSGLCGSHGAVVDGPRCRPAAPPGRDTLHDMEEPATDEARDPRAATLVCPFLVSAAGPWRSAEPARDHRCSRLTRSTHIEPIHQRRYCLGSGGPGCPHYVPVRANSRFVSTLPVIVDRGPLTATLEKDGVRRLAAPATVVIVGAALGALLLSRGPGAPGPTPGGSVAPPPGTSSGTIALRQIGDGRVRAVGLAWWSV